jgi:hypothetical protein
MPGSEADGDSRGIPGGRENRWAAKRPQQDCEKKRRERGKFNAEERSGARLINIIGITFAHNCGDAATAIRNSASLPPSLTHRHSPLLRHHNLNAVPTNPGKPRQTPASNRRRQCQGLRNFLKQFHRLIFPSQTRKAARICARTSYRIASEKRVPFTTS